MASRELVRGEPFEPRRVIVVVGDGHDSASKHTRDEVLELAPRNLLGPASPVQRAWLAGFLAGLDASALGTAVVPEPVAPARWPTPSRVVPGQRNYSRGPEQ